MKSLILKAAAVGTTVVATAFALATSVSAQTYTYSTDYTPVSDAAAATTFTGVWFATVCCAICIPLIIIIVLSVIVYKDAVKNKVENPILWALITFITGGVIGALIYFLAIRPEAIKKNGGSTTTTSTPTAM